MCNVGSICIIFEYTNIIIIISQQQMPTFFKMISMLWNNGSRTGLWNLIPTNVKY